MLYSIPCKCLNYMHCLFGIYFNVGLYFFWSCIVTSIVYFFLSWSTSTSSSFVDFITDLLSGRSHSIPRHLKNTNYKKMVHRTARLFECSRCFHSCEAHLMKIFVSVCEKDFDTREEGEIYRTMKTFDKRTISKSCVKVDRNNCLFCFLKYI